MKKILTFLCIAVFGTALSFSEINKPSRLVEFGFDENMGVSNNTLGLTDILVQDLVIDLNAIADGIPSGGFNFDGMENFDSHVSVNLKNLRFKVSSTIDASGSFNISKNLFTFLADGNGSGGTADETFSASMYGDVFFVTSAEASVRIKRILFSFIPALVVPVVHVEALNPTATYTSSSDGTITATASSDIAFYSFESMDNLESLTSSSSEEILSSLFKGSGFDFTAKAQYPWNKQIDFGAYMRVPIVPGRLSEKSSMSATVSYETDGILSSLLSSDSDSSSLDYDVSDFTSESGVTYNISRPFRMGLEGEIRPIDTFVHLSLYGMAGFGVRYPYTSNAAFYPEYTLRAGVSLFNVLGLKIGTEYLKQVFIHELSLMLNAHLLEIDMAVSLQSSDFVNSFNMDGFGLGLGVKMGI